MAYKQVIILRKDLNMRKGKMVAQGAHASLGAIIDAGLDDARVKAWMGGNYAKICVSANSAEEIAALSTQAVKQGLISFLVTDSGLTEFHGIPTITALAIGPDISEKIDPITGELPLL